MSNRVPVTRGSGSTGSTTERPRCIDLEAVRAGADFSAEVVRLADELEADGTALSALIAEIATPVATSLSGYEPGLPQVEALQRARDAVLDELLGGEVR